MSKLFGKGLVFGLVAGLVLGGAGNLFAGEVVNSKDKVKVSLYGQVNRAVSMYNDGNSSYTDHVDNDNSGTRFGFKAKVKASDSMTAGANMEYEYQSNPSNKIIQTSANATGGGALARRKLEVYLKSGMGTITFGHGKTASDGTSEVDLSGTTVAGFSGIDAWGADINFYNETTDALSGIKVDGVMSNQDGNSRKDRLRYDTPKFGGFQISASTFEENTTETGSTVPAKHGGAYDLALRYSGKMGDAVKLAGAVAYTKHAGTDAADADDTLINGSLSVLVSGFSVTVQHGTGDKQNVTTGKADSESSLYGKVGYQGKFFSPGKTALAIDYGKYSEFSGIKDDEAASYAIYGVQKIDSLGTEIYTGYRIYSLDDRVAPATPATFKDIGLLFLGMRVKF